MAPIKWLVPLLAALQSLTSALYVNGSVTAPCDSPIYCHGDVLKAIELASPFADSKTFVDMPTLKPAGEVIAAFNRLRKPIINDTELNNFLAENFAQAGGELHDVPEDELVADPAFLAKLDDPVVKQFLAAIVDIWPDLTRRYAGPGNCSSCTDSFIPVNRTFVVAGGRFREPYYWDSFWIIEGLLRTAGAFTGIARDMIENFLDLVEQIGFVPNGARIYYLNRSQPPLLSQMVRVYVDHTGDKSILDRAVPLLMKEHEFWMKNRTVAIAAPDGNTYQLNRYHVQNNQPRPESYREDHIAATNKSYYATSGIIYPEDGALSDSQKADLYASLATGAESGWDYSARWLARPSDAALGVYFPLRSLNVRDIVPVDLNSILYQNEIAIARFLNDTGNPTAADEWADKASQRSRAMHALQWNQTLWSYFDYNLTSGTQSVYVPGSPDMAAPGAATAPEGYRVLFSPAQLFPFWTGAAPYELKGNPLAVKMAYARVAELLEGEGGGIPATNLMTGQQWDRPNVWPPLMYIMMAGLLNTPPTFGVDDPAYAQVQGLALRLAQRYLDSTFCTWYATGGSTSETPKLRGLGPEAAGIMFEKYAENSTNVAGGGGEYTVAEGFGWTNGVLIWAADTFGCRLRRPDCGDISAADVEPSRERSAVELEARDAAWTRKFGRAKRGAAGRRRS